MTPRIRFKIERFIVPQMLNADLDWRNASDTVFFFPFDHKEKTPPRATTKFLKN